MATDDDLRKELEKLDRTLRSTPDDKRPELPPMPTSGGSGNGGGDQPKDMPGGADDEPRRPKISFVDDESQLLGRENGPDQSNGGSGFGGGLGVIGGNGGERNDDSSNPVVQRLERIVTLLENLPRRIAEELGANDGE